jgi:uncharacterized RDD family membrane protein YckC
VSELVKSSQRRFEAHESARTQALAGLPLATFWQRLAGYFVDVLLAVVVWFPLEFAWRHYVRHESNMNMVWDFHEKGNLIVMLLYWGVGNYYGNGQTPGKWVSRTRVLSLTSERMGAWQSVERALGYGAAVLEGGLGFIQFFWDRNRMCAQDRLAETIVVDVRRRKNKATIAAVRGVAPTDTREWGASREVDTSGWSPESPGVSCRT